MHNGLGGWIRRSQRQGIVCQKKMAQEEFDSCGLPWSFLQEQWKLQQVAQLSVRACRWFYIYILQFTNHICRCTCSPQERTQYRSHPSGWHWHHQKDPTKYEEDNLTGGSPKGFLVYYCDDGTDETVAARRIREALYSSSKNCPNVWPFCNV